MIASFRDLEVWKRAHSLALDVYRVTEGFPDRERFGITAQLRRSSTSVPANIAEGFGRKTTKDFLRHLAIANGSLEETRYFLILSCDLGFLRRADLARLEHDCDAVAMMLSALRRSLLKRSQAKAAGGVN